MDCQGFTGFGFLRLLSSHLAARVAADSLTLACRWTGAKDKHLALTAIQL